MKPEYDQELIDSLEHMSIGNLTKYKYDTYYMYCVNLDKNTRILAHTALEMYNDYEIKYLKRIKKTTTKSWLPFSFKILLNVN